jgi:hypothetical protein
MNFLSKLWMLITKPDSIVVAHDTFWETANICALANRADAAWKYGGPERHLQAQQALSNALEVWNKT